MAQDKIDKDIYILGIETSCDETAAAVVDGQGTILSNQILSQFDAHEEFGGVVPEIAAREHLIHIDRMVMAAMTDAKEKAGIDFSDLSGVAATCGPGLIGGVMIGMMTGKAIAAAHNLPFFAVNHLEGHALSARLSDQGLAYPFLLLLVSGGHTTLVNVQDAGVYTTIGATLDDALGELFDKAGKMMGLAYPGGPEIEKMAAHVTDAARQEQALARFDLPRPMKGRKELNFSFSGLKTAVKNHIDQLPEGPIHPDDAADLCYALQEAIADVLQDRCGRAMDHVIEDYDRSIPLIVAGGVAANKRLRMALSDLAATKGSMMIAPPGNLCSDNAAMIAWAGVEMLRGGRFSALDVAARPRWPLDQLR